MATSERKARLFRQRETELLDAALALYAEEPWRAVTVDRIAARAGIAKGTVYLHVGSKEEVAAKIALRYLKRVAGAWSRVPESPGGRERLLALLDAARATALAHPGQFALTQAVLTEPQGLQPEIREELAAAWRSLEAALASCFDGRGEAPFDGGAGETGPQHPAARDAAAAALAWALIQAVSCPAPLPGPSQPPPDGTSLLRLLKA